MNILIEKPGILTTVQDLGRQGFRRFGINPGGVMDAAAARLANILVGNDDNAAVLEMHFPAPQIVFQGEMVAAVCGAEFGGTIEGEPVDNWRCFTAANDTMLKFTDKAAGNRAYLAVRGGFEVESWLGSSSTNLTAEMGGFGGRKLAADDSIGIGGTAAPGTVHPTGRTSNDLIPYYRPFPTVRIIEGGEFQNLTATGRQLVCNQDFTLSNNSNRMGFRLVGEPINLSKATSLISSAVSFGTIQLLPDGQLIVLMADHQTAGGYPRIAHVISRDLPLMAQLGAGDKVAFHLIDLPHAEDLAVEYERELSFLRARCRLGAIS